MVLNCGMQPQLLPQYDKLLKTYKHKIEESKIRTPIMISDLTFSMFLPFELEFIDNALEFLLSLKIELKFTVNCTHILL
jgi:hypothetical protein